MRVLHVIASMNPKQGGVSQAVKTMIAGLAGELIDNEVVSLDAPGQDYLKNEVFTVIHAVGPAKGPWCYSAGLTAWLMKNFSRFDAVIIHGLWLYPGYAVKKALKQYIKEQKTGKGIKYKIPRLLVMPHGMLDPYFQEASGRKLKAIRNKIYWKLIESKIVNNSEKVLFTTEEESVLAKKTFYPYRPKAEAVVGLGVEEPPALTNKLKEAFAQKCPVIGDSPFLLFLSRIHEKKGVDILINAYASILQERESSTINTENTNYPKLVIAGPGLETAYGEKIKEIVYTSPVLQKNVIFTGMLTGNAKWGAFYGCEAFILPSYQENFGIAVVEAMACQKPVLISDKINIWREINTTNSGIVRSAGSIGVNELLQSWFGLNKEMKRIMSNNARSLFQQSFAVEAAAKQLAATLQ